MVGQVQEIVLVGGRRRAQHTGTQEHRSSGGSGGPAEIPCRHPEGDEAGLDAPLLLELSGLVRDRASASACLLEGRRLTDEVRQPRGTTGHEQSQTAGVRRRQVEGARGEVAIPEQGVATAEVDQVSGPRRHGAVHRVRSLIDRRVGQRISWSVSAQVTGRIGRGGHPFAGAFGRVLLHHLGRLTTPRPRTGMTCSGRTSDPCPTGEGSHADRGSQPHRGE